MNEYEKIISVEENSPHFQETIKIPQKLPLVYQYRDFSSFWSILKSDSFWATNARFSNDQFEQLFGLEVISNLCEKHKDEINIDELGLDENYIICFCLEDDKLSQWRGYAPNGGVAMGFDFGMPRVFSILNKDVDEISEDKNCTIQYIGIDAVKYMKPQSQLQENEGREEKKYGDYCREQLNIVEPLSENDIHKVYSKEIQKKAPYIKHYGFVEEDEYRLVFRNERGELDKCIRYRDTNDATLRYPYIVVKTAMPDDMVNASVVRVCIQGEEEKLVSELEQNLKRTIPTLIQGCHLRDAKEPDAGEPFCNGCVLRRWESVNDYQPCRYKYETSDVSYEYYLHEDVNCLVVSQGKNQKEVFEEVHSFIKNYNKQNGTNISVWCEGHLPLRRITVGPCPNQDGMVEAIKHYCKHTYWLRDVEIVVSKIPYRKSL